MQSVLTEDHIEELWLRMARIYGHKWVSGFGESDDGTWLTGLKELTPQQLADGLHRCIEGGEEWPPSLPQFRSLCLGLPSRKEFIATYQERLDS